METHGVKITTTKKPAGKRRIALIAHDAKKSTMISFAQKNKKILEKFELVATGTMGKRVMKETGLNVKRMLSSPQEGDLQIGRLVASGEIDLVIFLRDPLTAQPHEPDISALMDV